MVGGSFPERHDVRALAGLIEGFLLDLSDDFASRLKGFSGLGVRGNRGIDASGHILDGLQHIQFKVDAFALLSQGGRVKTVPEVVLFRGAELLEVVSPNVVVGDEQAVLLDEAPRAARVEAHGGFLQVFKPGIAGLDW